jgi:hypothetical protein
MTREVDGGFIGNARSDRGEVGAADLGTPTLGDQLKIAWFPRTLLDTVRWPHGILRHGTVLSKTSAAIFGKDRSLDEACGASTYAVAGWSYAVIGGKSPSKSSISTRAV